MTKKQKIQARSAAAAAAALIAVGSIVLGPGDVKTEGVYTIREEDENRSIVSVSIPEQLEADVYELYLNGQYVDKNILPNGVIIAPPIVFSEPERLEARLFRRQAEIGTARFTDGRLIITKKEASSDD